MKADRKLCFVVGPMGENRLERLRHLAHAVVEPLVEEHGFVVETPDHADVGSIMNQVLLSLEQADLLIADLTGNNPNVMYELAIYHTTGRPYITVRDACTPEEAHETPFDIRAYRFIDLPLGDASQAEEARKRLAPTLTAILDGSDPRSWYSNPVTDFYQGPVTHLRYASAMAENYVRNFVRKVVHGLFEDRQEVVVNGTEIAPNAPLSLEIVLPKNFNEARHEYVKKRLVQPGCLVRASVLYASRRFSLHAYPDASGGHRLVDVPTILATIRESVEQRMGAKGRARRVDVAERARLEAAEARRFRTELAAELDALREERFYTKEQIRIVDGNPFRDETAGT